MDYFAHHTLEHTLQQTDATIIVGALAVIAVLGLIITIAKRGRS